MSDKNNIRRVSSEYPEERAVCKNEYRIRTVSEMITVSAPTMFGSEKNGEAPAGVFAPAPSMKKKTERDVIESVSVGMLEEEDGILALVFEETVDPDEPSVPTRIEFDPACPDVLTLKRSGVLTSTLCFDRGNYRHCEYVTPLMPFEVCIFTRRLENTVTRDGGRLVLDYAIELRGAAVQRVMMTVDVTKL